MATSVGNCFKSFIINNNSLNFRCGNKCFPRLYSVFAPDFKSAILDREEIKNLMKTEPKEKLLAIKVKPTLSAISPSSAFYHPDVEKLINCILRQGKRELAKTMVRDAFTRVKHIQLRKYYSETDESKKNDIIINPLEVYLLALKNVTPLLWYVRIKKSGSWYKVPIGISEKKAKLTAIKWLIESAKVKEPKCPFEVQLGNEIVAAFQYEGKTINKKLELHKLCEANRSYIHYWWT